MAENESENKKNSSASSVWNQITEVADKVIASSKKGIEAAGTAINEFGDKSVLRIELSQLKSKLSKLYKEFGEYAASTLAPEGTASLKKSDAKVKDYLAQIQTVLENIEKHEKAIAAVSNKDAGDSEEPASETEAE